MGKIHPYLGSFENELFEKLYLEKVEFLKAILFLYIKKKNCSLICPPKQTCQKVENSMDESTLIVGLGGILLGLFI